MFLQYQLLQSVLFHRSLRLEDGMLPLQADHQLDEVVVFLVQGLVNIHHLKHHFLEIHSEQAAEWACFVASRALREHGHSTCSTHGVMPVGCFLEGDESNDQHETTIQWSYLLGQSPEPDHAIVLHRFDWGYCV